MSFAHRLESGSIQLYIVFGVVFGVVAGVIAKYTGISLLIVSPIAAAISSLLAGIATSKLTGTRMGA